MTIYNDVHLIFSKETRAIICNNNNNNNNDNTSNNSCTTETRCTGAQRKASEQGASKPCCPFVTRARLLILLSASLTFTFLLVTHCSLLQIAPRVLHVSTCCTAGRLVLPHGQHRTITRNRTMDANDTSEMLAPPSKDPAIAEVLGTNSSGLLNDIRYKHMSRRLPQCLIVGVRKGGTRALLEFLNLHPSIQAHRQELHFFDDEQNYSRGLEWYQSRMPYSFANQITIEKTPAYFVSEQVPRRVYGMNSTIRLLLIVRDPVARAISDYMQIYASRLNRGKFYASFEDLAIHPITGDVNRSYKAIRRSIYHRHLSRWLGYFTLDQFHFVSGENLVRNPLYELRKVEEFLGIEHRLSGDQLYFNRTRGFYCMHVDSTEKCLASSKGRPHPDISTSVTSKLRDFFRPHNARFYQMVGRDFGWPS